MTRTQIEKINCERIGRWQKTMAENHATAVLVVAIGHDQAKGKTHVLIPEDMPNDAIIPFLAAALKQLHSRN